MPAIRPSSFTEPVANEIAAVLRHDLVTPINLIVGYCDLLLSEAADSGRTARMAPLRAIRGSGYVLLSAIDQVLLSDQPPRPVAEIQQLARGLEEPTADLMESCDALITACRADDDWTNFADDVGKIRSAGSRMLEMARSLGAGRFPEIPHPPVPAGD